MAGVVVVGSANIDQVFRVVRIPSPGETVLSTGLTTARGGKGQNQAVAAARAGAVTSFVGAVGADDFGRGIRSGLDSDGVATSQLREVDAPTGTALIAVDDRGENTIIVEAGANGLLSDLTESDAAAIRAADVLVLQLEIPLPTVLQAADLAHSAGTTVVLNAAPIRDLPDELLDLVDVLVVNEHEAAHLAAARSEADDDVARAAALTRLVPAIVVTLGGDGAALYRAGEPAVTFGAPAVTVVDTTGAGDTFCGALATLLSEGADLAGACRFAVVAGSLSVERAGAVPSIPARAQIDARLAART